MIIEKQELLIPVFIEVRYMTNDPRDRNCLPPVFSEVRYMTDEPRDRSFYSSGLQ